MSQLASSYLRRCGHKLANANPILYTCLLTGNDVTGKRTTFPFDLDDDDSPLIIVMDLKKYADTINGSTPTRISFLRPDDSIYRTFHTYVEADDAGCERLRIEIVPHDRSSVSSLMASIVKRPPLNILKKIHRFTDASAGKMKQLLSDADMSTPDLEEACDKFHDACEICASTGSPADWRKISLTHINSAFNEEVQENFVAVYIGG